MQIGVNAFYAGKKPYEKTGQFLLTAWLYQFVEGGKGELRFETPTGLGRMDILLTYNRPQIYCRNQDQPLKYRKNRGESN